MPDYINEIPAKLSSVIARILAGLSSVENLGLTETFARLPFVERLILVHGVPIRNGWAMTLGSRGQKNVAETGREGTVAVRFGKIEGPLAVLVRSGPA